MELWDQSSVDSDGELCYKFFLKILKASLYFSKYSIACVCVCWLRKDRNIHKWRLNTSVSFIWSIIWPNVSHWVQASWWDYKTAISDMNQSNIQKSYLHPTYLFLSISGYIFTIYEGISWWNEYPCRNQNNRTKWKNMWMNKLC